MRALMGARIPRRALLTALARREFDLPFGLAVAVTSLAAIFAAVEADALRGAAAADPLLARLVLRFDLTVLGLAVMLGVLRTAQRAAEDAAGGWLEGYRAAGADMHAYGASLIATSTFSAWLLFALAAACFAFSVLAFEGAAEPLRMLPLLLGGGLLLILAHVSLAACLAMLFRDALAAVGGYILLAFGPLITFTARLSRADAFVEPGPALRLLLQLAPPLQAPADARAALPALLCAAGFAVAAAAAAGMLAGRRP